MSTDILKPVRECVQRHKAKPPAETVCKHCGHHNGGAWTVCPICKRPVQ